jgi:hypothetical protein
MLAGAMLGVALPPPASAGNSPLEYGAFVINHEIVLPGTPEVIFDAITGDISGWWDHTFSESPARFVIEPKPGGAFWEIFDDTGDGARHATVIYAERGKRLRFVGPLGLSGKALHMVHTYEFLPEGDDSTRLQVTVRASGEVTEDLAKIVDGVWHHFLFEQFKPYVEAGKHLKKGK